jgi:hypothetical protein
MVPLQFAQTISEFNELAQNSKAVADRNLQSGAHFDSILFADAVHVNVVYLALCVRSSQACLTAEASIVCRLFGDGVS